MSAVFIPAKQKTISAISLLNSGRDTFKLDSGISPVKNLFNISISKALFSGTSALGIEIFLKGCNLIRMIFLS